MIELYNDIIKQLGIGINISRSYPSGHPSLLPIVQRLKILFKELPIEKETISLVVIEDVIVIEEERIDSRKLPIVKSLVDRFRQLGVKSITFNLDLLDDDIMNFFSAMSVSPADLADYGDIVALVKAKGVRGIRVNKYRVGVISSEEETREISLEGLLSSLSLTEVAETDEAKIKELGGFLSGIGIKGDEAIGVQTNKIVAALERMALLVANEYGEERWDEYSLIFSRMLTVLSPTIKKNIVKHKTENKKLTDLFRNLIPTMSDNDIRDIVAAKAKEKTPNAEREVVDILKNITGPRLADILSTLRTEVPEINFEKVVTELMNELKITKGTSQVDKSLTKNLEIEIRKIFPRLRDPSSSERKDALDEIMTLSQQVFETGGDDLIRLLVNRLDTMTDAETEIELFIKIIQVLKSLYQKAEELNLDNIMQFISKKFGKHLIRKEATFLEKKKVIIKAISELRDKNYVPELISLLWDPGVFVEAREALISLADSASLPLIDTLKETEDHSVRMKIVDVLVRMGEKIVPQIKGLLSSPDWYVRRNGLFILGEIRVCSVVDDIGKLIDDEKEQIQLAVIESLSKIGGPKATDYIKRALNSQYRSVILAAVKSLQKDDVKPKLSEITQWLKTHRTVPDEKEEIFRREIISLLGKIGDDSVIDTLSEILNEKALFKANLLNATKESALNALAKIGTPRAIQSLRDATAHKNNFVATMAQEILKKFE